MSEHVTLGSMNSLGLGLLKGMDKIHVLINISNFGI